MDTVKGVAPEALDPHHLHRFVEAQSPVYEQVLSELNAGKKTTHWIWYVFPQLAGLGTSQMARKYAIQSIDEARAYLAHPLLGARLVECTAALNSHDRLSAREILGDVDAAKVRSCMTLFAYVAGDHSVFHRTLEKYYSGEQDALTLARL